MVKDKHIEQTLQQLHKQAKREIFTILKGLVKGIFRKLKPEDMKNAYISLSQKQGLFLYDTILQNNCKNIIEFGTSFGISTLYLAAGAKENGGKVISTEILPEKCKIAMQNFTQANALDVIDLREGDAIQTLKNVLENIDFLLLDGWNDLYLPLLQMLEPRFKKACIVITDNTNFPSAKPFLKYVRNNPKYKSDKVAQLSSGTEYSLWLGND